MQIKDKRVIVTGAASGLGLAFSKELLRNGASVCPLLAIIIISDIQ
jgi:NAD(P)-dependent dehydrogenase (short-subunit alcohol dehydrogenase family)